MKIISHCIFAFLFFYCPDNLFSQTSMEGTKLDTLKWINNSVHSFHMEKLKLLNLDSVTNGFDSLIIRVFINFSLTKPDRIVELRLTNSKWKGVLINYNLEYNQTAKTFNVKKVRKKRIKPKSGWEHFINGLIESKLMTLPDAALINNYPIIVDGISYCIEISTLNSYRFYCYSNPDVARETINEAGAMEKIIEEIYTEVKIK